MTLSGKTISWRQLRSCWQPREQGKEKGEWTIYYLQIEPDHPIRPNQTLFGASARDESGRAWAHRRNAHSYLQTSSQYFSCNNIHVRALEDGTCHFLSPMTAALNKNTMADTKRWGDQIRRRKWFNKWGEWQTRKTNNARSLSRWSKMRYTRIHRKIEAVRSICWLPMIRRSWFKKWGCFYLHNSWRRWTNNWGSQELDPK